MDEGDDGKGGKVGMSRKLVTGIIVAVVVAAGVGAVVWWESNESESTRLVIPIVLLWRTNGTNNITLMVERILYDGLEVKEQGYPTFEHVEPWLKIEHLSYRLYEENNQTWTTIISGNLSEAASSEFFGLRYIDKDNNALLTLNDTIILNKSLFQGYDWPITFALCYEGNLDGRLENNLPLTGITDVTIPEVWVKG